VLVTFTTKYHADITMFGDIGVSMLKMMGHSATVPGAILAADVTVALEKLQTALSNNDSMPQNNYDDEPTISLSHRALPLIELLGTAVKEGSDVMWK